MTTSTRIRIARRFPASPARVFDAWLDPAWLGRWMFGPGVREEYIVRLENDPQPGGRFSFVVRRGDVEIDHVGEYVEIDRPHRLVFTWDIRGASDDVPSRVTVELSATNDGCELTLVHDMDPSWAPYADRTRQGWTTMVDKLAEVLVLEG